MDIKKIVKRNLRNMVKDVLHIPIKCLSIPWGYGFAHASYLYFYITNPNGTDDELNKFLNDQAADFDKAIEDAVKKFFDKLDRDDNVEKWLSRLDRVEFMISASNRHGMYAWLDIINETRERIKSNGYVEGTDRCRIRHMEEECGYKVEEVR